MKGTLCSKETSSKIKTACSSLALSLTHMHRVHKTLALYKAVWLSTDSGREKDTRLDVQGNIYSRTIDLQKKVSVTVKKRV